MIIGEGWLVFVVQTTQQQQQNPKKITKKKTIFHGEWSSCSSREQKRLLFLLPRVRHSKKKVLLRYAHGLEKVCFVEGPPLEVVPRSLVCVCFFSFMALSLVLFSKCFGCFLSRCFYCCLPQTKKSAFVALLPSAADLEHQGLLLSVVFNVSFFEKFEKK